MQIQAQISEDLNVSLIGKKIRVLIDREEEESYIGRTEHDSPEVDPEVIISSPEKLETGRFYDVIVSGSDGFDLFARI